MAGFRNKYYRSEWKNSVPGSGRAYSEGTYFESGEMYAVYDGGQNLMGYVHRDGTFSGAGELTEYSASFLRSAKEELVKNGLVGVMSGDEV